MNFDLELLKSVLSISAPSGMEDDAKIYVESWIATNIPDATVQEDKKGNLYITKGQADKYPTFVGHLDDVHSYHSSKTICELNGFLYAMDAVKMEQIGTAGDDKVGMYLCLEALRTYDNVKCFFPVEEEWGTVGTSACDLSFFDDSQYVIQSDRKGAEDIVVSTYGTKMTSKVFDKVAARVGKAFGYKLCHNGGLTDVVTLKADGLKVCAINIASGYYHPHSDQEIVDIQDVNNMINTVSSLVEELGDKVWKHKHQKKAVTSWDGYKKYGKHPQTAGFQYNKVKTIDDGDYDTIDDTMPIQIYNCIDCGGSYDKTEMITSTICNYCAEWYNTEYGHIIAKEEIVPQKRNDFPLGW